MTFPLREAPVRLEQRVTWMHDALDLCDRWRSSSLRSASPSPGSGTARGPDALSRVGSSASKPARGKVKYG